MRQYWEKQGAFKARIAPLNCIRLQTPSLASTAVKVTDLLGLVLVSTLHSAAVRRPGTGWWHPAGLDNRARSPNVSWRRLLLRWWQRQIYHLQLSDQERRRHGIRKHVATKNVYLKLVLSVWKGPVDFLSCTNCSKHRSSYGLWSPSEVMRAACPWLSQLTKPPKRSYSFVALVH